MAKQASKTVIGGFVISAIILIIGGVIVFGSGKMFEEKINYVMFFNSSVTGLSVGSPVICRGVEVGSVTGIVLDIDSSSLDINVPVFAEIYPGSLRIKGERPKEHDTSVRRLIERGMRAQLSLKSIVTGQMMVEIVFQPGTEVHLTGLEPEYYEIPTIASAMNQFAQKLEQMPVQKISKTLLSVLQNIDNVLEAPEVMEIVRNLDSAGENLAGLLGDADNLVKSADKDLMELLDNLDGKVDTLSASIQKTLDDTQILTKDISREMEDVGGDARKFLKDADLWIEPLSGEVHDVLASARESLDQARGTLKTVDGFIGTRSDTRQKMGRSLDEISAAARSLKSLMDYLERHPESLLQGKGSRGG